MGHMKDGQYFVDDGAIQTLPSGEWERSQSVIRDWIDRDGSFAPEAGRYHLFVAWNCPWAHRALLTRVVKKLEDLVSISVARPNRTEQGWIFDADGEFSDPLLGVRAAHEVYTRHSTPYTGRITVPILWDKSRASIVNNESADIVRMFNSAFEGLAEQSLDLYPLEHRQGIDNWNDRIYRTLNNGVYRAGFASTQSAYEIAAREVFSCLDAIEEQLANTRFLLGDELTEADIRLFPTLARFDAAYYGAFKCNIRRLTDYPNLWPYARSIYQLPGIADTVRPEIYRRGYFSRSEKRNPYGVVPLGPEIDWSLPHGR